MSDRPRVILVTGAASGIGAACCRALAGPGTAFLVHTRKNEEGAARTAAAIEERGGRAVTALGDIGAPDVPARLVEQAVATFGGLDVVVANAGFADRTPLMALEDEVITRSLDTILWGFIRLAKAAAPALAASENGRLIAISSFVAHVFRPDVTTFPATAAAKGALEATLRAVAIELAPAGTTVNAVAPGFTQKDPGTHTAMTAEQWKAIAAKIPMGRIGTPEDVAQAVAYFASPGAAYVTGQLLHVSGGLVA
ncbi:SDR family oxidoreductase [Rhodovarius crocodyli]|uniref:SDR family oxidoreductase n=1 Tax=Rhodovarius crocodyli TaxID=1979269 RepID=A0A437MMT2_9PROT|nr:SDR family oxidoreductase [Rhodovarius crocodyli]RVT98920.1 SDR family oxidoreductase [Rhodovarius crocodyli]